MIEERKEEERKHEGEEKEGGRGGCESIGDEGKNGRE